MGDRRRKVTTLANVEKSSVNAPMRDEAYYELGRAQMDLRNHDDAIRTFTRLRETTKDNTYVARALIGLGMVYRNASNYDKAL